MTHNELAARIERAEGAELRELTKAVFAVMFPDKVPSPIVTSGYGWREDKSGWWLATGEDARTPPQTIYPPKYLTSIDAAMQLVPAGHNWAIDTGHKNGISAWCFDGQLWNTDASVAATPALALCAAALRARSAS
jgi:hypothetical protein